MDEQARRHLRSIAGLPTPPGRRKEVDVSRAPASLGHKRHYISTIQVYPGEAFWVPDGAYVVDIDRSAEPWVLWLVIPTLDNVPPE